MNPDQDPSEPLKKHVPSSNHQVFLASFQKLLAWYRTTTPPMAEQIQQATKDPYRVLIGVLLSARTKDQVTHQVTKRLFSHYPTLQDIATLSLDTLTSLLYPVGFYKTKARYIQSLNTILLREYHGMVPQTRKELMRLPGVGRKTANLVLAVAFGKDEICVDTHVHRISNLLGWVKTRTPLETELALRSIFPKQSYRLINPVLVRFGQEICKPQKPLCNTCPIKHFCPKNLNLEENS